MPSAVFHAPFDLQVEFLRHKLRLPTATWRDIWQSAHDRAFVVAGAVKADLLADLHAAVVRAAEEGRGIADFRREFDAIVARRGWYGWTGEGTAAGRAWRTRVIYQTNMATSHAAGRWAQINDPALAKFRPYIKYHHSDSVAHPRPLHVSWHGLVLPKDHPLWQTHAPPNGWGCQCWLTAAGPKDYEAARAAGKAEPPAGWDDISEKTGAPVGIDKGWAYNPGASRAEELQKFAAEKAAKLPGQIGAAFAKDVGPGDKSAALPDCSWGGDDVVSMAAGSPGRHCIGIMPGQRNYKDFGRPDLRDVPAALRLPSPGLIEAAATREFAVEVLAAELGLTAEMATRVIRTPIETLTIAREWLPHMVKKELDARERYARFILPTLLDPFEVYLTEYDDGRLRPRYIGLFQGARDLMCIVRRNRDGSVLWNLMQSDHRKMNDHRVGELIHARR